MQYRPKKTKAAGGDIESLYSRFLRQFYDEQDIEGAEKTAVLLERCLGSDPEVAQSIRADEIRSLLSELRGDVEEAIRHRERELRRILELHTVSDSGARDYVLGQYGFSDIADRLDLLANLYANRGDVNHAIATLMESKQFCELHDIAFDGQELLDELENERRTNERAAR